MDEHTAERLRMELMWDHDADPHKLTQTLDELRALQVATGDPEQVISKYRKVVSDIIDFFERMRNLAESEAGSSGGQVDFSDSTYSQIILDCVRGYPDYARSYWGLNDLFNIEMEKSSGLEQQLFETARHYEGIIQEMEANE